MHEAEVSFRHLGTAEVRLWPFSHCLSAFFRSLHCLRSDLARKKTLIPGLISVSLQRDTILHTKGFGRLVDGDKHWGKEIPQDLAVWQGNQLRRGLLMGSAVTCLLGILCRLPEPQGQRGHLKPILHPTTWSKTMPSFCCHFMCPSPASQCKQRL